MSNRDSVLSTVIRLQAGQPRFRGSIPGLSKVLRLPINLPTESGTSQPPNRWGFETFSGLRWSERENEHQVTWASLEDDIKI
jgi:hypothetical protein